MRLLSRPRGAYNEDDIPVGVTKIGGWPDLLRGARWPGGSFVCQIALAEVPDGIVDLPTEGLLSLFADPSYPERTKLIWSMPMYGKFERMAPPDSATLYMPRRVETGFALTLDLSRSDAPQHDDWQDAVFDAFTLAKDGAFIQLGGDAQVLNPMLEQLEDTAPDSDLADAEREWRLVLRVGSIGECEIDFSAGLYVWMRAGDLRPRRFENAVAIVQAF
jgi:hypothetical protein